MSAIKTKVVRKNKTDKALKQYKTQIEQIIAIGGQMVRNEAVKSIQQNSGGGKVYTRGGTTHVASPPNSPPNTDTGFLASNVFLKIDADKMGCSVESRADYSEHLEFGTSKMKARPFLQPALEGNKKKINKLFNRLKANL